MASSTQKRTRPLSDETKRLFSCDACYKRKVKCDRGNPCTYCCKHQINCAPSPIETNKRPRKKRFPESELLAKIKKYEAALLSYGADLEVVLSSNEPSSSSSTRRLSSPGGESSYHKDLPLASTSSEERQDSPVSSNYQSDNELKEVMTILDGLDTPRERSGDVRGQKWFDRIFANDTSSFLFAIEPAEIPNHPAPFDLFKLWQIYYDNVHPLHKILHAPTFQRKISTYGSHLHLAPASEQALFFAVYVAAVTSLSAEECEATFFTTKKELLEQYKLSTQVWLRRAGLWRTSEFQVLQALVLFLSSVQNVVDVRTVSCFTSVADRIARRMGIHRNKSLRNTRPIEQEMQTRLWWELILLDSKAVERAGLGTSVMAGNWNVRLPLVCSDTDLESLESSSSSLGPLPTQPSSEMIVFLIRAESAHFLANLRNQPGKKSGWNEFSATDIDHAGKLKMILEFETRLRSRYLNFCDSALPQHRLAFILTQAITSRMRISACIFEESFRKERERKSIRSELLQQCTINLQAYNQMRSDVSLERFTWFMMHNLPIFAYIHILRLLQTLVTGKEVDEAWQAVETLTSHGIRRIADSLTIRAWNARKSASPHQIEDPAFIKQIHARSRDETFNSSKAATAESDCMAMLAEMMSGEANDEIDWSTWFNEGL